MDKKKPVLFPRNLEILSEFGENIKLARLRRKFSVEQVSERANIGRTTLWAIEKGSPNVALGFYFQVLFVLGLEEDFLKVAADDVLGRRLQDAKLLIKERAPKKRKKNG